VIRDFIVWLGMWLKELPPVGLVIVLGVAIIVSIKAKWMLIVVVVLLALGSVVLWGDKLL
jgi:hypothetical protein